MVLSKLDTSIEYEEKKTLYDDDNEYETDIYELMIHKLGYKFSITFGKQKLFHIKKGIIFFPIYLVNDNKLITQLGVVEITNKDFAKIIDEDENIDMCKIKKLDPLIYEYVKKSNYKKYALSQTNEKEVEEQIELMKEDSSTIANVDEFLFKKDKTVDIKVGKEEETGGDKVDGLWIQKFLKSSQYDLIDNEGGGDCLFAVIRDAYTGINWKTTVSKIRKLLANSVTRDLLEGYKTFFMDIDTNFNEETKELKILKDETKELKEKFKKTNDRNLQKSYQEKVKENIKKYEELKSKREMSKELLKEFEFMRKVKTIDNLKEVIQTCTFWADTWAISTLEKIMNVKLVILSSEAYNNGDIDNVLQCGQVNDTIQNDFDPAFYVLLDYTGDHYKLITYQNNTILRYDHLPEKIKEMIITKCMENGDALYNKIPQFKEKKEKTEKNELEQDEEDEEDEEKEVKEVKQDKSLTMKNNMHDEINYDNTMVFQVYNKSNDKPLPGKGTGEKIALDQLKEFTELGKIINWRRKLSNEWEVSIKIDGYMWNSAEHYINANKFKTNQDYFKEFTVESGSDISKSVDKAKEAGMLKSKTRPKDIKIDSDYESNRIDYILKANKGKFEQNEDLKNILKLTKKATIKNYLRGKEAPINYELMKVRELVQ